MEIHVIRHTRTKREKDKIYGRYDTPLEDTFYEEVEEYRRKLDRDYEKIYSSPLRRCVALAEALGFSYIPEPALMEYSYGDWENRFWHEIPEKDLKNWMDNYLFVRPPGGESFMEFYERVKTFLETLKERHYKKILLITHKGVIRCLMVYYGIITFDVFFSTPIEFGEVYKFFLE